MKIELEISLRKKKKSRINDKINFIKHHNVSIEN